MLPTTKEIKMSNSKIVSGLVERAAVGPEELASGAYFSKEEPTFKTGWDEEKVADAGGLFFVYPNNDSEDDGVFFWKTEKPKLLAKFSDVKTMMKKAPGLFAGFAGAKMVKGDSGSGFCYKGSKGFLTISIDLFD